MLGWNSAAPALAAEAGVAIPEAVALVERAAARAAAAAAAAETGGAAPEAVVVAAEAEVVGVAADSEAAAPIPAFRVSCVCRREPFVCEHFAAQRHVSHWRHYSFAEALSVFSFPEKGTIDPTYSHFP